MGEQFQCRYGSRYGGIIRVTLGKNANEIRMCVCYVEAYGRSLLGGFVVIVYNQKLEYKMYARLLLDLEQMPVMCQTFNDVNFSMD